MRMMRTHQLRGALDDSSPDSKRRRGRPRMHAQLGKNAGDVVYRGMRTDEQGVPDLTVGLALCQQLQHFQLPPGQPVWIYRRPGISLR